MSSRPITSLDDLKLFLSIMTDKYGVYGHLAQLQFSWGLRFQTASSITVGDARKCLKFGYVDLMENKTGKLRACSINARVRDVFMVYLDDTRGDEELLFGKIVRETYNLKLKVIGMMLGFDVEHLSSHSLRKSFAYLLHTEFDIPIDKISQQMNHADVRTTLIYAGIQHKDKLALTQIDM